VQRKRLIKEKLDEMKSSQNFKGLKQLSKIAGVDIGVSETAEEPATPAPAK